MGVYERGRLANNGGGSDKVPIDRLSVFSLREASMDAVDGFSLRVEQNGQGPVVWVSGELDIATAPLLRDCLDDFNGQPVTIDFSGVTFLDSSGLAVLIWSALARRSRLAGAAWRSAHADEGL